MAPPRVTEDRLTSGYRLSHAPPGDEVLITGISGYFPQSDSVAELQENLFKKVDLVTCEEKRWSLINPEIPRRAGNINNLDKFDASFFNIHYKEAHTMDPVARILLEKTYEAIFDAGVNPRELRDSKTGVYIAITSSESEKKWTQEEMQYNDFGLTGCSRAMMAARISRWLGVSGPSFTLDSACCSAQYVVDLAFRSIREGRCDSAIVCTSNLCLNPYITMQFSRAGVLSTDGKCKCFDDSANGYVRSEAIVVLFLQKAKNSRRAYTQIVYTNTSSDGFKEHGIAHPSEEMQKQFLNEFYEECCVSPQSLDFCEAHGTGTRIGDVTELNSIDAVFCNGRLEPLSIGSIKSNIGHTEFAAGLCSIVKMCIAYSSGYIPPNLHYNTPRKGVKALAENRIIVVTDKTPWQRGMAGVSGLGFGGSNAHVLLKNFAKDKINQGIPCDDLPRLVCVSGRTESAVARILNDLESKTMDVELLKLLHSIHDMDIEGHTVRGYSILHSTPTKCVSLSRNVQYFSGVRRPVWFVYSSMDLQWASIVVSNLMKIPVFAEAIHKCHKVLEPKGINLTAILTEQDPKINDNILNTYIGIAVVQIGLTDILKAVGIEPDNAIGHGIGELGCAYAYGSLTAEETIRSAYSRGLACMTTLIKDSMSAENIGCKQDTVPFDDTFSKDRRNIIIIEITPQRNQQNNNSSPMKDEFNIPLVDKNSKDNVLVLFNALGKMYEAGLNPHLAKIYPHVPFPVSQGTPMLSHLVEWEHSDNWSVALFKKQKNEMYGERTVKISLSDTRYEYLTAHNLDGCSMYPGSGYLVLVWETLGVMMGRIYTEVSVVFENVQFLRVTNISQKDIDLEFIINIHKESGDFEVMERDTSVATGKIYAEENVSRHYLEIQSPKNITSSNEQPPNLFTKDIYNKEIKFRGYQYEGLFKSIQEWNFHSESAHIGWANNWVTFLDGLVQLQLACHDTRDLILPTRIEKLSIDVHKHYNFTSKLDLNSTDGWLEAKYKDNKIIQSGGVEMRGVFGNAINKRPVLNVPVLEKREFVFNFGQEIRKMEDVLRIYIQLIVENVSISKIKSIELADEEYKKNNYKPLIGAVEDILGDLPLIRSELLLISDNNLKMSQSITVNKTLNEEKNCAIFIGANLLLRPDVLQQALSILWDKCFIISREKSLPDLQKLADEYDVVCVYNTGVEYLVLFRKLIEPRPTKYIKVVASDQSYSWIDEVKNGLKDSQKVVLYCQGEPINGLLGLVSCLRKEVGSEIVYALYIAGSCAPVFDPDLDFYKKQIDKDLAVNVFQEGQWGTFRQFLLDDSETVLANHAYVNTVTSGDLTSLRWLDGNLREDHVFKTPNDVLVHVYCAALNFHDVMVATGRIPVAALGKGRIAQQCLLGIEIAGKTADGARVMCMVNHFGLANVAVGFKPLLIPVPEEWSFEEAATIPVAYSTAYYAMVMVGRMQRGESILIHAGSGGMGQAAINVALHYGCEIFTTVGTAEKRAFIKKLFPQLKDSHIGNSRDISFEDMIRKETNGKGVDLVLNSLADEKLQASIRCLGSLGRFLEIGKFDICNNTPISMHYFDKEISFHGVMLDRLFESYDFKEIQKLQELILDGIKTGAVRPLTYCTFEKNDVEAAFRYMGAGKHIGKVIIKIRDEDRNNPSAKPTYMPIEAMPRYNCYENHVYVIVGGLGGFGLELIDWLILRGARKIMIASRRGVVNGYQAFRIKTWTSYGANVQISTDDVTTEAGCKAMLNTANAMGPVEAIFNLATILKDALFQNQTPETFRISFEPKARATMHLDKISMKLCPELKEFVVFSSISCNAGIAGQTNYAFSNSTIEKICEERKKVGLSGRALQWGAIGDVGLVAERMNSINVAGTFPQKISSCLLVLDQLMKQDAAVVTSIVVAEKKTSGSSLKNIEQTVSQIMGIKDLKTVSQQVTLAELGMDSITAVEIKKILEREFEVFLTSQDIRTMTFPKLSGLKAKKDVLPTSRVGTVRNK